MLQEGAQIMLQNTRDIILTFNIVESGLVQAVKRYSQEMGRPLYGLVFVDTVYAAKPNRKRDESGFFTEIICDSTNPSAIRQALKPYRDRILAATCRYDSAMDVFRRLIPFIPYCNTPTETSLLWATEKPLMRDQLASYDQSLVPMYQRIESNQINGALELVKEFQFPVIVKPSGLSESLLVERCDTPAALMACLKKTFAVIDKIYARERRSGQPTVLVEEMMQGDMFSVDAYVSLDGTVYCLPPIQVFTGHAMGMHGFYGFLRKTYTDLSPEQLAACSRASEKAVKALGLRAVTTHIELFNTLDGWKIIEIAARMGGYREQLYREAYGVDHYYNDLAVRLGYKPQLPDAAAKAYAACMHIYAEEEGEIEAINGIEEVRALVSTLSVVALLRPGDQASFSENGGKTIINGIFSHAERDKLDGDIAQARKSLAIVVKTPKGMNNVSE